MGTFTTANRIITVTACGRQFVGCFEQYLVAEDKRVLIERLLLERISLRGICRAVGFNSSGSWAFWSSA